MIFEYTWAIGIYNFTLLRDKSHKINVLHGHFLFFFPQFLVIYFMFAHEQFDSFTILDKTNALHCDFFSFFPRFLLVIYFMSLSASLYIYGNVIEYSKVAYK